MHVHHGDFFMFIRFRFLLLVLLLMALSLSPLPAAPMLHAQDGPPDKTLRDFAEPYLGIQGRVPADWAHPYPGQFLRGDGLQDATALGFDVLAGYGLDEVQGQLAQQFSAFGVEAYPRASETLNANGLAWELSRVSLNIPGQPPLQVHLALAETETGTLQVSLLAPAAEGEALAASAFLPAVESLQVTGPPTFEVELSTPQVSEWPTDEWSWAPCGRRQSDRSNGRRRRHHHAFPDRTHHQLRGIGQPRQRHPD
jgi:hypothetical protein